MIPDHVFFDKCWTLSCHAQHLDRAMFPQYYTALQKAWQDVEGAWGLKPRASFPVYPANGLASLDESPWMKSLAKAFKFRCKALIVCIEWVFDPGLPCIFLDFLFRVQDMGLSELYHHCLPKIVCAMPFTVIKSISPFTRSRDSKHPPTRMEYSDPWRILRIHPVVFYSRALCQTVLNLSPEEVHDRMKPHCQDIRLIADGVLALVTDQELSAQASDEMSNRILVALGRPPVDYDDSPYRPKPS